VTDAQRQQGGGGLERLAFRMWAWVMTHPRIYLMLARMGGKFAGVLPKVGPLGNWASQREIPGLPKASFHQWWAARKDSE
jgi:L-lactate dehydrogenase complex protein LldF